MASETAKKRGGGVFTILSPNQFGNVTKMGDLVNDILSAPLNSPAIFVLSVAFGIVWSVRIYDTRLSQVKTRGLYSGVAIRAGGRSLPDWVAVFGMTGWVILIVLVVLNWRWAIVLYVVLFILRVMPVLEWFGEILMTPLLKSSGVGIAWWAYEQFKLLRREYPDESDGEIAVRLFFIRYEQIRLPRRVTYRLKQFKEREGLLIVKQSANPLHTLCLFIVQIEMGVDFAEDRVRLSESRAIMMELDRLGYFDDE